MIACSGIQAPTERAFGGPGGRSGPQSLRPSCGSQPGPSRSVRLPERSGRAFTLIEMVTLIIIIAVISAVVVPSYTRFRARGEFQSVVETLRGELSEARNLAVQNGTDSVVRFDPQTDVFMVTVDVPDAPTDVPETMQESADAVTAPPPRIVPLAGSVAVREFQVLPPDSQSADSNQQTNGPAEMRFHEDGRSDGGLITLVSEFGYAAQLEVSPLTGVVTVRDDNGR